MNSNASHSRHTSDKPVVQMRVIIGALVLMLALAVVIGQTVSTRMALLFATGSALGIVLYYAMFGFTSAFRVLLADGRSASFRAQMVMLGVACLLIFPALANGALFGQPVTGFVSPLSVSVAVGAFLFGLGMQMGGGCASGTLFAAGGGNTRMFVTLLFFVVGSVIGVTHLGWWQSLPAHAPVSLVESFGWPLALALNVTVFATAYRVVARIERTRHGVVEPILTIRNATWLRGPWPLLAGAVGLAVLNFVTLYLAGRPWGITSAFGLWGGMALQAMQVPVETWSGYSAPAMQQALAAPLLTDVTSVMDFGIMLGALLAAGMACKFKPEWTISGRHFLASAIGGLLLGYGARLAYGCNIGAFFSGIASGSLHGWMWIVFALIGNWAGLFVRPLFNLPVPVRASAC
ncbi:MAG: putative membrane protein YedE/YeeE [Burkholderiaceae bacterium]|jgi:uncharacterized membrane protein YedE/YeeE